MSSVWNFVKKHKGKFVAGGVVAGGVYAARRYLQDHPEVLRQITESIRAGPAEYASLQDQARKHYVFDSNQRTCDTSIQQLVPSLKEKLAQKFNVEGDAERLRSGEVETEEEKRELWERMKLEALVRLFSAAYGYSLLVVSLKAQISLLAAQIYEDSVQRNVREPTGILETALGWLSGVNPRLQASEERDDAPDSGADQLFLQSLQYFMLQGVEKLTEKIRQMLEEIVGSLSLQEEMSVEKLREVFTELRLRFESRDCRNFSYYVVPITASQDAFASHSPRLQDLLILLKAILESQEAHALLTSFVDGFLGAALGLAATRLEECGKNGETAPKLPLAKLVPVFSDAFHPLSSLEFDSVLQNALLSQNLHQFCVKIFNKDTSLL